MSNQLGQPELGFILPDGERCLKEEAERGHIEVAFRILESDKRMKARFERSQWAQNNPVDFLIFDEGGCESRKSLGRNTNCSVLSVQLKSPSERRTYGVSKSELRDSRGFTTSGIQRQLFPQITYRHTCFHVCA